MNLTDLLDNPGVMNELDEYLLSGYDLQFISDNLLLKKRVILKYIGYVTDTNPEFYNRKNFSECKYIRNIYIPGGYTAFRSSGYPWDENDNPPVNRSRRAILRKHARGVRAKERLILAESKYLTLEQLCDKHNISRGCAYTILGIQPIELEIKQIVNNIQSYSIRGEIKRLIRDPITGKYPWDELE